MQQALAQRLRIAHKGTLRLTLRLQRKQRKGHVRIFVIDHRPDHAGRQVGHLVADLLARLIELLLDFRRRRAVEQGQRGERQARPRVRFRTVVPAQLLHALFELLGDLILHFLRGGARPRGDDRHHLDRKRRVFRAAQLEEGNEPRQRDQADEEQSHGALAHRERRQVEAALAHRRTPAMAVLAP